MMVCGSCTSQTLNIAQSAISVSLQQAHKPACEPGLEGYKATAVQIGWCGLLLS